MIGKSIVIGLARPAFHNGVAPTVARDLVCHLRQMSQVAYRVPRRRHSVPGPAAFRVDAMLTLLRVPY